MNDIFQSTLIEMGRTPDIWDLQEDGTKYLGYCRTGTRSEEDQKFMIVKIEPVSESVSRRLYAGGSKSFDKSWSDREIYNYSYAR